MKNNKDLSLLAEVLNESEPPDFQATLFKATMQAARQRKRSRQWSGAALAMICLILGILLLIPKKQPALREQAATSIPQSPLMIVHSQALATDGIVRTRASFVSSVSSDNFSGLVASGKAENLFRIVGDDELLTLLPGHPAALVYLAPGKAELIFLNPEDSDGNFFR